MAAVCLMGLELGGFGKEGSRLLLLGLDGSEALVGVTGGVVVCSYAYTLSLYVSVFFDGFGSALRSVVLFRFLSLHIVAYLIDSTF